MATIVCDTDFLIKITNDPLPKLRVVDLARENEFLIILPVLREIRGLLSSKSPTTARRARQAMRVMEETNLFSIKGSGEGKDSSPPSNLERDVDDALVEFVREEPAERILATMDGSLLSRVTRLGLPYLTLRNGGPLFSKREWGQHI